MMSDRGKIIFFGNDFRRTANVIPRGSNADIIEVCIKYSPFLRYVQKFIGLLSIWEQQDRMNSVSDLAIEWCYSTNTIELAADMGDITKKIYGDFINVTSDDLIKDLSTKIILTTKNKDALRLNNDLLDLISGVATTYSSVDWQLYIALSRTNDKSAYGKLSRSRHTPRITLFHQKWCNQRVIGIEYFQSDFTFN